MHLVQSRTRSGTIDAVKALCQLTLSAAARPWSKIPAGVSILGSTGSGGDSIGPALRRERERRGWTREALAFHSGISYAAIAQIESGRRTDVRLASLTALADGLSVSVDYLLGRSSRPVPALDHRALLYSDADEFLAAAVPFVAEGLAQRDAVLVVTTGPNTERLRSALGRDAGSVDFGDSRRWYDTPLDALSRYRCYIDERISAGTGHVRIIGEPVWRGRSRVEAAAWTRYEALINLALAATPATILCPYPVKAVPSVLAGARRTHPEMQTAGAVSPCAEYGGPEAVLLES